MRTVILCCLWLLACSGGGWAQITLRGVVRDAFSHQPLAGAHVELRNEAVNRAVATEEDGLFRFDSLPAGYYDLAVSYLGYESRLQSDILVGTGREVVLDLRLPERATALQEVVVSARDDPRTPINELALVSTRSFSVAETKRYAGAVNDPARMALAYAGVSSGYGDNNELIIRGNSPRGLLWRLEGIEIPNPNHFAEEGSSGGLLSILSNTTLTNSDFYIGAFPANIGNAYSGVFDLRLRNGNEEQREFSLEAGLLGLNASAEGPFHPNSRASYLFSYRYSTLGLLQGLGIIGDAPRFQDLTFKINVPIGKVGNFALFGIAGQGAWSEKEGFRFLTPDSSSYVVIGGDTLYSRPTDVEIEDSQRYEMGVIGAKYGLALGDKTYLQSSAAISGTRNLPSRSDFDRRQLKAYLAGDGSYRTTALRVGSTLHHKLSSRLQLQTGLVLSRLGFQLRAREGTADGVIREVLDESGRGFLTQGFVAGLWRPHPQLTVSGGLHATHFSINRAFRLEPRVGLRWDFHPGQALSLGFGEHNRHEAVATYFGRQATADGAVIQPNTGLPLMKARHFVLGYDLWIAEDLFCRLDAYYQYLYDVPVDATPGSAYSSINEDVSFTTRRLSAEGTGKNVGIEATLEKTFTRQYYFMFSASLFDATYRMPDGAVRHAKYNLNHVINVQGGKEFSLGRTGNRYLGANVRTTWAGGKRIIPIDFAASQETGVEVRREEEAYSRQLDDFFRLDASLYFRLEARRVTHQLKLEVINLLEHNVYEQQFTPGYTLGGVTTSAAVRDLHHGDGGNTLLPFLSYRVDF